MRRRLLTVALLLSLTGVSSGCWQEYSFEQKKVELGTLGHELWKVWHKDAARAPENAEAKAKLLDDNYQEFVDAVDTIAPEDQYDQINTFLGNLLSLIDDGIVPALTRKLQVILSTAADDDALLAAVATPSGPAAEDFVSPDTNPNLLGYVTGFPELVDFLGLQSRIVLENDGIDDAGKTDVDESSAVSDLVRVLARALRNEDTARTDEPLATMVRDMMLVEDDRFAPEQPTVPVYAALYDDRGYPLATGAGTGDISFPFVDEDGDGRADLTPDGEFKLQNGSSATLPPFSTKSTIDEPVTRDQLGRAKVPGGFAFQYVNLQKTALGFLVRQYPTLSSHDTLYDMLVAFQAILGSKQVYNDDSGGYQGYPVDQPLMDLSYAAINIADTPALPDVLDGVAELAERKPDQLAALMWALDDLHDALAADTDAGMSDDQTVLYDLLPVLRQIVEEPGLWQDLMAALRTPISTKTGEALSTLMEFKDQDTVPVKDGPYDSCFHQCESAHEIGTISRYQCIRGCPNDVFFSKPMDFDAPETRENHSQFQALLHLLRDTAGVPYAMNIEEASYNGTELPQLPPLIALPAAAEAFTASIAGNLDLADYVPDEVWSSDLGDLLNLLGVDNGQVASLMSTLSPLFGTKLDVQPKPSQITRLFNQPDIKWETDKVTLDIADPVCKDGYVMSHHLAYGLFLAEAAGVIDTLYPLAKAFSDHGREDLLTAIFVILHDHYSAHDDLYRTKAGGPSPMKGANMRSYEKTLDAVFKRGELFDALNGFAKAVKDVEDTTGKPVEESLRQFLAHALATDGFTNRRGEDYVVINDGRTIQNPSRFHFLVKAVDDASTRLDSVPEQRKRLRKAVGNVVELLVGAEKDSGGQPHFIHRGSPALTATSMHYLSDRAREKVDAGELDDWLQGVISDLEDFWSSRALAALVDLANNTLADDGDKQLLDDFVDYLTGTPEGQTQVLAAVHQMLVKSVARARWLPIARFLADVVDPDQTWESEPYRDVPILTLGAEILKRTMEADPDNTGIFLIHRGLVSEPYKDSPFAVIVDIIARYLSPDPSAKTFQKPDDYRHFLQEMNDYLGDDVHGVERLYELVDRRIHE